MNITRLCAAMTLIAIAFAPPALAQKSSRHEGWAAKPFQSWTKAEAQQVLNDSPWARTQEVRGAVGGANAPIDNKFTLRLRSALPIRQALVRLKQIEARYDQMDEKARAAFDEKTKGLLECPACADNYVVTLSSRSENSPGTDWVHISLAKASEAELKQYVYIANERGEQRRLIHFDPPRVAGEPATFFFPRLDEKGQPLLTGDNRKLLFRLSSQNTFMTTNFDFEVSKLMIDGSVGF